MSQGFKVPGVPIPQPRGRVESSGLTPTEKESLAKHLPGWREGDAIAENVSELFAAFNVGQGGQVSAEAAAKFLLDEGEVPTQDIFEVVDDRETTTPVVAAPVVEPVAAGDVPKAATLEVCPNCFHDLTLAPFEEPSEEDKAAYLDSIIDKPFAKQYELFGGRVKVTFRELSQMELDSVYQHAYGETQRLAAKTSGDPPDFRDVLYRYRLGMMLTRIHIGDLQKSFSPTEPFDWLDAESGFETIEELRRNLFSQVWCKASVIGSVFRAMARFSRLCERLGALSDNDPFWGADGTAT